MKSIKLSIALLAITSLALAIKPKTLKINTQKSEVNWLGKKVTGQHSGNISLASGNIEIDGKNIKSGSIVIDMTSITCTDIKDAEYNKNLIGHLKSDDFFGTEKFNTANFEITGSTIKGKKTNVIGKLTIKGITQEISIPVSIAQKGKSAALIGTVEIDRTKFDIKYGSKSFFESIGDKAIDNNFTLTFKLVGISE